MTMHLHCMALPKCGNYFTRAFLLIVQEECWDTDLQLWILEVKFSSIYTDARLLF